MLMGSSGLNVRPPVGSATGGMAGVYAHSRSRGFGAEVKRRVLLGTYALSAEWVFMFRVGFVG